MLLNRVRFLFQTSSALFRPLRGKQIRTIPNFVQAQQFKHYSTVPEQNVLPNKADVMKRIEFTCKVCNTRNKKQFSNAAYTKGVVLIRCDGCNSNHLIADNLKWFDSKTKNIEDILAEKGIQVKKGVISFANIDNANESSGETLYISADQK